MNNAHNTTVWSDGRKFISLVTQKYAPVSVFVTGVLFSLMAFFLANHWEDLRITSEFKNIAERHHQALRQNMTHYEDMLHSMRAVMLVAANDQRGMFHEASQYFLDRYPGVQALEWVPHVMDKERAAVEYSVRLEGFPSFEFVDKIGPASFARAPERPEYLPILYVEPLTGNEVVMGYDLMRGPTIKELLKSRADRQMTMSKRIYLAQERGGQYGIIAILPTFSTEAGEDGRFLGYVQGVFRLGDMLGATWRGMSSVEVETLIVDVTNPAEPDTLYYRNRKWQGTPEKYPDEFNVSMAQWPSFEVTIADRRWQLYTRPTPEWLKAQQNWSARLLLIGGILFAGFFAYHLDTLRRRAVLVEKEVAVRTRELQDSREHLRLALDSAQMGAWEFNRTTRQFRCSDQVLALFNLKPEEFDGRLETYMEFVHPEDREKIQTAVQKAIQSHQNFLFEYRIKDRDGRMRWLETSGMCKYDEQGQPTQLAGVIRDVSERKEREAILAKYATALDQSVSMVFIMTPSGQIEYCNQAVLATMHRSHEEMLQHDFDAVFPQAVTGVSFARIREQMDTGNWRAVLSLSAGGSKALTMEVVGTPVRESSGRVMCYLMVGRDITKESVLEQQLRQSQKMEAVGLLAGGIAHDFNNLLQIIAGYTEIVLENCSGQQEMRADLGQIKSAAERARQLIRQLLLFSRRHTLEIGEVTLRTVVADILKMVSRLIGEHIEVRFATSTTALPPVSADRSQLEQVVMNLCINARDAMPKGGILTVELESVHLKDLPADAPIDAAPGEFQVIRISDTGCGMTPETVARIFEPFFTTKAFGKGTGLGLAVAYGIVKKHGGFIQVVSELGHGSTFSVFLPATKSKEEVAPQTELQPDLRACEGTILLVEDEAPVRQLSRRVLQKAGFRIIEATNGQEAVDLFDKHRNAIDLVVTDVVMPGMGGYEAYLKMHSIQPNVRVLFCSGYSENALPGFTLPESAILIQKPFSSAQLLAAIRSQLASRT